MAVNFDQFILDNLAQNHDWKMEETSGNIVDGPGTIDLAPNNSPVYDVAGDVTYLLDRAIRLDGVDQFFNDTTNVNSFNTLESTGSVIIVFNLAAYPSGNGSLFIYCNAGSASGLGFQVIRGGTDVNILRAFWGDVFGVNDYFGSSNNLVDSVLALSTYHMWVIVQPGDAGGFVHYLDGTFIGTNNVSQGTGDNDDWWAEAEAISSVQRLSIGCFGGSTPTQFVDVDISRVLTTTTIMTAQQVTDLNDLRVSGSVQTSDRRTGRRVFTLDETL